MAELQLTTLFERGGLAGFGLPDALRDRYGGDLGFEGPVLYANFVESLDGVVSLGPDVPPSTISGRSEADRFVMGLVRACADAVVVGAGTLRTEPDHVWTAEHIFPELAGEYRALRRQLGMSGTPRLVLLTRSGNVDPEAPALRRDAIVVTTEQGRKKLAGRISNESILVERPFGNIDPFGVVTLLKTSFQRILTEGGPSVLASFLREGLVDELFLTLSPRLAGRDEGGDRLGLVEGHAFAPGELLTAELLSAKRHDSHLFLRYRLERPAR